MKTILVGMLLCISLQAQVDCPLAIEKISWRGASDHRDIFGGKAAFSIDVKNVGTKTITAVHWDFILVDNARQQVFDHFKFITSDKTISPEKKTRLTKRIDYLHTPNYVHARAVIRKIVYSDGSTWENPGKLD
jgi:hypothetical protein